MENIKRHVHKLAEGHLSTPEAGPHSPTFERIEEYKAVLDSFYELSVRRWGARGGEYQSVGLAAASSESARLAAMALLSSGWNRS